LTYHRDYIQYQSQAIGKAQLDTDAANLKNTREQEAAQAALVAKKTVRAPFGGRLGITTVNPGQYLNPGDPIVTLQTVDPVYVDFRLPQDNLSRLAEAVVRNPEHKLLPGMFVRTTVDAGGQQHYLTLPQTAITYNPYGQTVYLVRKPKKPGG